MKHLDLVKYYHLAIDALFRGIKPILVLGATKLCTRRLPWPRFLNKLVELEYDLRVPNSLATNGKNSSRTQSIF